jgi:FkbM family methyltransferase
VTVVEWLNRRRLVHFAIDRLGGRRAANAVLARVPVRRTLEGSGVRYRCRYLDSIPLAEEVFREQVYAPAVHRGIRTFVDLGSNVGYFAAFVAHVTGRRDLRGLAVDADPDMARETAWTLSVNGIASVHAVHGLVTAAGRTGESDFYLHPVKIKSSAYSLDEPGRPFADGGWRKTRVEAVDVGALWQRHFGDARCDLLKVDIEGGEADFITQDNPFLRRVDAAVVEVHKWVTTLPAIDAAMRSAGLERVRTLRDSPGLAVAHYARGKGACEGRAAPAASEAR